MLNKRTSITLIFTIFLCMVLASITWAGNNGYVPGELLIRQNAGVSDDKVKEICASHGAYVVKEIHQIGVKLIRMPEHALETVMVALENNPNIEFAEPNFIIKGGVIPNDLKYPDQWHLPKISAPDGWDTNTGSTEVVIAIIDSGVDSNHPDLMDKLVPGKNFLCGYDLNNTDDVNGHGTAVAGTAAATTDNEIGVAGVNWESKIMPLVVLGSNNYGTISDTIEAIIYAADNGVEVINLSLGGPGSSIAEKEAIDYAWGKGVVIIACAMNYATETLQYPAAYENVVAVSATTSSDTRSSFSNFGNWIDIAAPGSGIYTTNRDGGYGYHDGTSFSSPIVAGLAALILSVEPDLTNSQVVDLIEQNADDLGDPGYDIYFGHGRVNVYESLIAATGTIPDPDVTVPSVSIVSPGDGSDISSITTVKVEATDNIEVIKVELYIDNIFFDTRTSMPYDFSWDTNDLLVGSYELSADAYDAAGNVGYAKIITVHKQPEGDVTPPTVSFICPNDGDVILKSAKINASASDDIGIVEMRLYIDGDLKITKTRSIVRYTLNTRKFTVGDHILLVEAKDAAGNVGSASITITID